MTLRDSTGVGTRRFFVSYTRADREMLQPVLDGVDRLQHEVWIDNRLTGGQEWWDEILRQLRDCDAVLIAVSPALLESEAAAAERAYARALGKPLLPVVVRPTLPDLLPGDLATLQLVDFSNPDASTAFQLASAIAALPAAPPLPVPLPVAPPVPRSYVSDLAERVRQPSLGRDEQVLLVEHIRTALAKPSQRDAALEVLAALEARDDLFAATSRQIEELRRSPLARSAPGATRTSAPPASPPSTPASTAVAPPALPVKRSRWKRWVVVIAIVWAVLAVIGYAAEESTTPDEPELQEFDEFDEADQFEQDPFFQDF